MPVESATYISDLNAANPTAADPKSEGDNHFRLLKSTIKATFPGVAGAVTASHAELNILDGATLSTAELNVLDGVTASTAELNKLDGVMVTTADINSVTSRALKAGDTYTGTHDFTGGTLNVPTASAGSSGSRAASLDFVNATASSAALPGQAGNAGKVIGTDGTNASWVSGGMKLLATLTPTVAAAVNALSVFSSDYDSYVIVGQEIGTTNAAPTSSTELQVRLANGGVLDTATTTRILGAYSLGAGGKVNFSFEVLNANGSGFKSMLGTSHWVDGGGTVRILTLAALSGGNYPNSATVSGLGFLWGDGSNFSASGKIYIYGRTKV